MQHEERTYKGNEYMLISQLNAYMNGTNFKNLLSANKELRSECHSLVTIFCCDDWFCQFLRLVTYTGVCLYMIF